MRRLTLLAMALGLLLTATHAQASTIQVGSAASLGATDFFDWGQVRLVDVFGNAVSQTSTKNVASNLGATGSIDDGGLFTGLVEGTDFFGDFTVGNNVLFTGDAANIPPVGASSFTMNFDSAVAGLGLQITSNFYGAFTASLEVFNGATSLGVFNVGGVMGGFEDGSSPFLGALSDAANIDKAVFTLTSNTGAGLGVNRLLTTSTPVNSAPVPEPASLTLLGLGLAGMGARRWRQRKA